MVFSLFEALFSRNLTVAILCKLLQIKVSLTKKERLFLGKHLPNIGSFSFIFVHFASFNPLIKTFIKHSITMLCDEISRNRLKKKE